MMRSLDDEIAKRKKVVAGAAIGVAVPAVVAVARKLIGDQHPAASSEGRPGAKRTGSAAPRTARRAGASAERTKDQLYREAKRLGIEGRSKMTKAQLERAVSRSRS